MSDRDRVLMAARALRLNVTSEVRGDDGLFRGLRIEGVFWFEVWSPHTDDAQCARLAWDLNLRVEVYQGVVFVGEAISFGRHASVVPIEPGEKPYSAVRRAILLTASEIGNRSEFTEDLE